MTLIETCDIDAGGIRLSARTAGTGPLVLLVHGFPGSAWSWRHQMAPLAEAGWQTVAIDTRGYGGSERPADGPWTTEAIEQDLLGVIDSLGAQQAVVVGQDFGAKYAWNLARHHPDRVRAVAGTVPFADLPQDAPPSAAWATLGEEHFLHLHYFQAPGVAERDLGGEHVEEFLRRLLWALSAGGNYFSVFGAAGSSSYLDALAPAPALPWSWLTEADFATYAEGFRRGGAGREFAGGFGSYRAADADWAFESRWLGVRIDQPALLFIGELDPVRKFTQVDRSLFADLSEAVIPGAGHHVQQEQPAATTKVLLDWLAGLH
ncbi:alpha/beta fold hydrolase [Nocardioides alcanivorans]|uniref:alpha/beta fold hydrolase n=1 Tax=Nocardioides alcanivorans TaxID=2897352 RepID=UPI001F39289B|nr:alpha/beta hydrolase [Nocardioides alcanivorans]